MQSLAENEELTAEVERLKTDQTAQEKKLDDIKTKLDEKNSELATLQSQRAESTDIGGSQSSSVSERSKLEHNINKYLGKCSAANVKSLASKICGSTAAISESKPVLIVKITAKLLE